MNSNYPGSVYSVVVVSLERYSSICRPFHPVRQVLKQFIYFANFIRYVFVQGRLFEGDIYIFGVVVFSFLYNITKFLEFKTVWRPSECNSR